MQRFLKSIGFGNIRELEDQDRLLHDVLLHHDEKNMIIDEDQHLFAEISREYAPDCGITVCGIYDSDNLFHLEYYYPYFRGAEVRSAGTADVGISFRAGGLRHDFAAGNPRSASQIRDAAADPAEKRHVCRSGAGG